MKLKPLQELVVQHYIGGVFAPIEDTEEIDDCGDTLFSFCMREAHDAQTASEFQAMLETAIKDLRSLQAEMEI